MQAQTVFSWIYLDAFSLDNWFVFILLSSYFLLFYYVFGGSSGLLEVLIPLILIELVGFFKVGLV